MFPDHNLCNYIIYLTTLSVIQNTATDDTIWNEEIVAYFNALHRHSHGDTEEKL